MRRVLITGAGSGFGYLTALALARRGNHVYATMRILTDQGAANLARTAEAEDLPLTVHRLDVTDTAMVDDLIGELSDTAGGIDVLVNNAGFTMRGPVEAISDAEALRQFDTNVFGVLRPERAVAPRMRARGSGTIVNISSLTGFVGSPFQGAYAATKHAVEALSESLRFELAPYGVQVVIVEPGSYDTGFADHAQHAAAFDPDHPLWTDAQRFFAAWAGLRGPNQPDPAEVVEAVCAAVEAPDTGFRRQVGADATRIYALKRAHDHEEFERIMRDTLNLAD
jgi:NAD(P)-dependent dehydrogenase (short-subunit alcohol dehydrogenase family)